MVALVKQFRKDTRIRYAALGIVQDVAAKDFRGEVEAIFQWVQQNIKYHLDPNDVELVATPIHTLEYGMGDCDDMATTMSAMLESIGHPCRFCAVGFGPPNEFEHVLVQTLIGTVWVPLDATEPHAMGWEPPGITTYLIRST